MGYKDIVTNANTADQEKYDHLTDEQRSEVIKKCDETTAWLDAKKAEQANLPKSVDPVLTIASLKEQRDSVKSVCSPIVNTPKPKPVIPEPKDDENADAKSSDDPAAPEAAAKSSEGDEGKKDGADEPDTKVEDD